MSEADPKDTIRYGVDKYIRQCLAAHTDKADEDIIQFAMNGQLGIHAAMQELTKQREEFQANQKWLVERCAKLELENQILQARLDQSGALIKKLMGI